MRWVKTYGESEVSYSEENKLQRVIKVEPTKLEDNNHYSEDEANKKRREKLKETLRVSALDKLAKKPQKNKPPTEFQKALREFVNDYLILMPESISEENLHPYGYGNAKDRKDRIDKINEETMKKFCGKLKHIWNKSQDIDFFNRDD